MNDHSQVLGLSRNFKNMIVTKDYSYLFIVVCLWRSSFDRAAVRAYKVFLEV